MSSKREETEKRIQELYDLAYSRFSGSDSYDVHEWLDDSESEELGKLQEDLLRLPE